MPAGIGYDNLQKKYRSTWIVNMGTGLMNGTGNFDVATQTLKNTTVASCPMSKTASHTETFRTGWKFVDKNTLVFTLWGPDLMGDGKEFKSMEMTYTRVK